MPIKYMGKCSEHKVRFVPNICSEVELFRTYKLPNFAKIDFTDPVTINLLHGYSPNTNSPINAFYPEYDLFVRTTSGRSISS